MEEKSCNCVRWNIVIKLYKIMIISERRTGDMNAQINNIIRMIPPADQTAMYLAQDRQSKLAKPPGSLGKLEEISVKLAGMTGQVINKADNSVILVFCADNGIIEEGVSSAPRSVTAAQAVNMTKGLTGMSSIAKALGAQVVVADIGIADEYVCPEILNCKIARGTRNFLKEDAMPKAAAERAILTGASLAFDVKKAGAEIIGIGEMGIGNTSTSTAVLSALTGMDIDEITGRGGGLTDEAFARKKAVLKAALERRKPDPADPVDVISKVGGLDIAAMCGAFLGAAANRMPAVIDGFISAVAALCAAAICPNAKDYMFPSHRSFEPGYTAAMSFLGLDPWLDLDMRLGEGSGCPIAFQVIKAACAAMSDMALFGEESAINDGYLEEIRKGDSFSYK